MKRRHFLLYFLINTIVILFYKLRFNTKLLAKNKKNKQQTKVLTHPVFLEHIISKGHPESPDRIRYILDYLEKKHLNHLISNENYTNDVEKWIKEIHSNKHIRSLKKNFPSAEKASSYAVKSCIHGVNEIINEKSKNVFCAVRPPGHHALNTGKAEGFCFYNHIAVTARYLQIKHKIKKIMIIDWDYHHGNSTELFFYEDPSVLFFSTHDANAYPGTGLPNKIGEGKGKGFNINIHMPCGTSDNEIINIYKERLTKNAKEFKPEFILISAGFDSRINDPLGCFKITDNGFKNLTKIVMDLSEIYCQGRILSVLEGGYNLTGNAKAVIAHVEVLNNFNKKV